MSKFCMQCGAQIDDSAVSCPSCGTPQNPAFDKSTVQGVNVNPEAGAAAASTPVIDIDKIKNMLPEKKKKAELIAVIAVIAVVILVILRLLLSAGAYKEPFSKFEDAVNSGKGKYIYRAMPEYISDSVFDDFKKSEIIDEFEDTLSDVREICERKYGDDFEYSIEIKDKEPIKKSLLQKFEKEILLSYGEKVDVTKGYEVTVREKYKGEEGKENETSTYDVYKIDGEWFCPSLYNSFLSSYDYSDTLDKLLDYFD